MNNRKSKIGNRKWATGGARIGADRHIVDTHLHYHPGEPEYDPAVLFAAGGPSKIWLLSLNGIHKYATDAEVLALAVKYSGKIVPFAYLDLDGSPDQVSLFKRQGFAGLKVIFPGEPYDSPKYYPVWEAVQDSGLPVVVHMGGSYFRLPEKGCSIRNTLSKNMLTVTMDALLKLFPKIVFILAHAGGDAYCIETAAYLVRGHNRVRGHAPVYVDLAGTHLMLWGALPKIKTLIEDVGPEAVVYGSDTSYSAAARHAVFWDILLRCSWFVHAPWAAKIMGENADRIIADSGWSFDKLGSQADLKGCRKRSTRRCRASL